MKICRYCDDNDHQLCDGGWVNDHAQFIECDCATVNHDYPGYQPAKEIERKACSCGATEPPCLCREFLTK